MVEISIGLGIILSLVLSEALGVTAGGIIVPGYIALFLHQPVQVFSTYLNKTSTMKTENYSTRSFSRIIPETWFCLNPM